MGIKGSADLRHRLRRLDRLHDRRGRQGDAGDVHHDERRTPPRRRPGVGDRRGRLPGRGGVRPRAAAGARAHRREVPAAGGRPDPRPPRRAQACCSPSAPSPRAPARSPPGRRSRSTTPRADPDPERRQAADDLASCSPRWSRRSRPTSASRWRTSLSRSTAATATSTSTASSSWCATPASPRSTRAPTASRRSTSSAASSPAHMGRYLRRFFHPVQQYLEARAHDERLQ